jgi:aspartate dehydrogenase
MGTDLLVVSIGALADASLESALRNAATNGGGRLLIPGGALDGIDAVSAAREAGLDSLEYSGRKPPRAWMGTPAEKRSSSPPLRKQQVSRMRCPDRSAAVSTKRQRRGSACSRWARLRQDQDAPDRRSAADGNNHSFVARGTFGEISSSIRSTTLPSNPKTSVLAPFSLIQTIKKRAGLILA